jgi:hypothetical protein
MEDFTNPETTYSVVGAAMEQWIEKNYTIDFFPDGKRGARDVVQAMLDIGWQPPDALADGDVALHIQDNGGPGNGIVATTPDGGERFFPLPQRRQQVTLAQIRAALR